MVLFSRVIWGCSPKGDRSPENPPPLLFSIKLPQPYNGKSPYSHACCPKHLHLHTQKLKNIKFMEVKPHSFRHTHSHTQTPDLHAEHLQLCTLTPFQGVGRPINTTLQGLGDRASSHKMLSGDWYTLVSLFLSSGYCLSRCLPSWKVRMVTFPQKDRVGLNRAVINSTCPYFH